jgi:hypothetical protein
VPFSATPSGFFGGGYSLTASEVKLTTATHADPKLLTKLSDADANATTGDWRDICRALCYMMFDKWEDVSSGNLPVKARFSKNTVAQGNGTLQETYTFVYYTESDPQEVVPEP